MPPSATVCALAVYCINKNCSAYTVCVCVCARICVYMRKRNTQLNIDLALIMGTSFITHAGNHCGMHIPVIYPPSGWRVNADCKVIIETRHCHVTQSPMK